MASEKPIKGAKQLGTRVFEEDGSADDRASLPTIALSLSAEGSLSGSGSAPTSPNLALADARSEERADMSSGAFLTDGSAHTTAGSAGTTNATAITDEGSDHALQADTARSTYGIDGGTVGGTTTAIKIGILSDSFNVRGGAAADEADGDLPAASSIKILKEGPTSGSDEGRAMAELIHKIAPGAQIEFYSADYSLSDFAAGIKALQADGCQFIVDDITYFSEPFYQAGDPASAAIDAVTAKGATYFTSVGNEGASYYEQNNWSNIANYTLPGISGAKNVANVATDGTSSPYETFTLASGGNAYFDLQWAQPFKSLGGSGDTYSIGMAIYDVQSGTPVLKKNFAPDHTSLGNDPTLIRSFYNTTNDTQFAAVFYEYAGANIPVGAFKIVDFYQDAVFTNGGIGSGSAFGHNISPDANPTGAVDYRNAPANNGGSTAGLANESFSAQGGAVLYYDANGNPYATPVHLGQPAFSSVDGDATSVFNPFYGTSAAAPTAAACGALCLAEDGRLTNVQITYALKSTALAFGDSLYSGSGLINANAAVALAHTAATTPIWTAQGGSTNWSDAANWSDDAVPGTNDTAQLTNGIGALAGSYGVTYDLASSTIAGLTLDGGSTASPTLTIAAGDALTVSGATTIAGNGTLAVAGALASAQIALAGTLALTASGTGSVSGAISGTGIVVQSGTGTTTLTGSNTYSGVTLVQAGTLVAGSNGAFSASSDYTIDGTLDLNGYSNAIGSFNNGQGTVTNNGTADATLSIADDNISQFYGTMADGRAKLGLTVEAGKYLAMRGTATYSGATTVDGLFVVLSSTSLSSRSDYTVNKGGELEVYQSTIGSLAGTGNIAINYGDTLIVGVDGATSTFSGLIRGYGGLTKAGAGTFTLSGADQSSAATVIAAGTLDLSKAGAAGAGAFSFEAASGQTANLALDKAAQNVGGTFGNALNDFADSDTLDLKSFAAGVVLYDPNNSPNTLTVTSLTSGSEVFQLTGSHAGAYFAQDDGNGGTLITDQAPPVTTTSWIGPNGNGTNPGSGTYETAIDWDHGTPTALSTAVLGSVAAGSAYTVMVGASERVTTLQVGANATLQSIAGGDLTVSGNLSNAGTVSAAGGTIEAATSDLSGGVLSGRWNVNGDGAAISLTSSDRDPVSELASILNLAAAGSTFSANGRDVETSLATIDKGAVLRSLGGRDYTADQGDSGNGGLLAITDNGTIQLGGGTFTAASLSGAGTITGFGTLDATLENIAISGTGGMLTVEGTGNTFKGRIGGSGTVDFAAGTDTFALGTVLLAATTEFGGAAVTLTANVSDRGTLAITAGTVDLGRKTLTAGGAAELGGGTLKGGGSLLLRGATTLDGDTSVTGGARLVNYATLNAGADLTLGATEATSTGSLVNTASGTYDLTGDGSIVVNAGAISNAGLIEKTGAGGTGSSTLGGAGTSLANSGTIEVTAGTLEVRSAVGATGKLDVEGSAALAFDAAVGGGQAMHFGADGGTLSLSDPAHFRAKIDGFAGTDTIDFAGFDDQTRLVYHQVAMGSGTLSLVDGAQRANLTFAGSYTADNFSLTSGTSGDEALHFKSAVAA